MIARFEGGTIMLSLLDSENHVRYTETHLSEMRQNVEEIRMARLAQRASRSPRPRAVRRHVGGLLIAVGEALVR
jgi:hypothetical protein